jgi:pantoate--beta-alanine ligase
MVIRKMVRQFAMPIEIVAGETSRTEDGLALSSRNGYLSAQEREEAVQLSRTLLRMAQQIRSGAPIPHVESDAMQALKKRGWSPDYLTVRSRVDLGAPTGRDALVLLGAARIGATRLIDNLEI